MYIIIKKEEKLQRLLVKSLVIKVTAEGVFLLSSPGFPTFYSPSLHPLVTSPVSALDLPAASQKFRSHFHIFPS